MEIGTETEAQTQTVPAPTVEGPFHLSFFFPHKHFSPTQTAPAPRANGPLFVKKKNQTKTNARKHVKDKKK